MPHYFYIDHRKGPQIGTAFQTTRGGQPAGVNFPQKVFAGEVIFECDAAHILEADQRINAAGVVFDDKGKPATVDRVFMIGCQIGSLIPKTFAGTTASVR